MTTDIRRIKAVAAALKSIQESVSDETPNDVFSTQPYNNAVLLLEGALETDTDHLLLDDEELSGRDLLIHLSSLIAFLETLETQERTVVPIFGRQPN